MKYEVILEFDEDWTIDEIKRMLQEINLDYFCHVVDVKEMKHINELENQTIDYFKDLLFKNFKNTVTKAETGVDQETGEACGKCKGLIQNIID